MDIGAESNALCPAPDELFSPYRLAVDGSERPRSGTPPGAFGQYYTGEPRNRSLVPDPALDDLLVRQRRTDDVARREVINQIEWHVARQQYYVQALSGTYTTVWDPALTNYGPDLGYDYSGRLLAAWLGRSRAYTRRFY